MHRKGRHDNIPTKCLASRQRVLKRLAPDDSIESEPCFNDDPSQLKQRIVTDHEHPDIGADMTDIARPDATIPVIQVRPDQATTENT